MGRSVCAARGMTPGICDSSLSPPPANTSPEASTNGTWHMCSQCAWRKNCQSHYAKGNVLGGLSYVQWPLAAARYPG